MTPRDRLQRLLIEHRTAHDPASSEREILAMFEAHCRTSYVDDMTARLRELDARYTALLKAVADGVAMQPRTVLLARDNQDAALQTIVSESERLGLYDERTAHTKE